MLGEHEMTSGGTPQERPGHPGGLKGAGDGRPGKPALPKLDYNKSPFLIIWETTQACDLVCSHCRASAQPDRAPGEVTTEEGESLLRQAKDLGTPIFILSGGDPLKRQDLYHLIRYGADLGLRMATIPAATPLLTEDVVRRLKESGCSQMAQSLDFPTAELHDGFRGVPGAFAKTMQAIEWAHKHKMSVQINTTLTAKTAPYLDDMAELVSRLGIVFWEVFFLVPMGRGESLEGLDAQQCEDLFEILYQVQKRSEFLVKITEAPHYRRFVTQREWEEEGRHSNVKNLPRQLIRTEGPGHSIGLATQGVNSGNGFMFISHTGEIFPSGFLPLLGGHIRKQSLKEVYRESTLFRALRSPDEFKGICGYCEFNRICGGSRSRAYALTGDYMETDPWCAYRPKPKPATST
jgi:radical SAM protein